MAALGSTANNSLSRPNELGTRGRAESEYYIASIVQPDTQRIFRGWVPDQFNLSIQSQWEPILGSINEISQAGTKVAQVAGVVPNLKSLTRQAWTGTGPIDMHFNFQLDAYKDAYLDVQAPIARLLQMATPTRTLGGYILDSPGPTILSDKNRIYLRIGKFFYLDSIVITDIDVTYYTISDIKGQYQSADVTVGVRTHYTPDQNDILSYFSEGRLGVGDATNGDNPIFNQTYSSDAASFISNSYDALKTFATRNVQ